MEKRLSRPEFETRVGGIGDRVGILSSELDRLAADDVGVAAVGEVGGVLRAVVEPRAAFDAVVAGVLVPGEQVGLVEHQALRVFVGLKLREHLVWPDDQLGDRLEDLLPEGGSRNERIAIFESDAWHGAACRAALVAAEIIGLARVVDRVRAVVVVPAVLSAVTSPSSLAKTNGVQVSPSGSTNLRCHETCSEMRE